MSLKSQNLEQAKFSYEKIIKFIEDNKEDLKAKISLKSYAKDIPIYIKTNGLIGAYSFINEKMNKSTSESKAYKFLFDITKEWTKKGILKNEIKECDDFIYVIVNLNSNKYKLVEKEIISLYCWLRRFAEGEIIS